MEGGAHFFFFSFLNCLLKLDFGTYNPGQNIWIKIKKLSEFGQDEETVISVFYVLFEGFISRREMKLNEIKSKNFLKKFHKFTNDVFRVVITWKTRNLRSLFPLKDKSGYKWCVADKRDCSCGSRYIDETKRNA